MSEREKQVACPICSKDYSSSEIDCHVNKCIFLNSQEVTSAVNKRSFYDDPSPSKRVKNDVVSKDNIVGDSSKHEKNSKVATISSSNIPLAEQMRPNELSNFIGQEHVLGHNKLLRSLLERQEIPSMILWGPPGCGKTTLAHIIASICKQTSSTRFVKLSAIMAGINDVKELVKVAKQEQMSFKRRTILFMDEIHRFNKLQQDVFLPHVESGTITLIGATTENPSFSLNSALLSRCRVIVLEKHKTEHLYKILENAIESTGGKIVQNNKERNQGRYLIERETVQWLAEMCDGDARIALNSLQLAIQTREASSNSYGCSITLEDIKDGVKRSHILYDKKGDEHYNIISAMHKSIRASDDNAALYWVTRMIEGGEDPIFIARRLVRAASEDIGLADPMAVTIAVSAMQGCQLLGMPECDVLLAQCAVYLARAPKSVEVYHALGKAKEAIEEHKGAQPSVPLHLRNAPTRLMKNLGYGKGYNTAHKDKSNLMYMPEGMEHVNFFEK